MRDLLELLSARWLLTALFATGAMGALSFMALYAVGSRRWYNTPIGRNLAAMMITLFALLGLVTIARTWGPLPRWVWAGGIATMDVVIWWRVTLLWRTQRGERAQLAKEEEYEQDQV